MWYSWLTGTFLWWCLRNYIQKELFLFSNLQDVLLGNQNHIVTEQCSLENIYTDKDHNGLGFWKISAALKLTGIKSFFSYYLNNDITWKRIWSLQFIILKTIYAVVVQLGESHLPCQGITSHPSVWKAMSSTARNARFEDVCRSRRPSRRT